MFFMVDCIYRRYHTRSIIELNGLLHLNPMLGIAVVLMIVFFSGLPGTIKFTSEFFLFNGVLDSSFFIVSLLFINANVIGLIGFSKS